jgi:hypothetical protein
VRSISFNTCFNHDFSRICLWIQAIVKNLWPNHNSLVKSLLRAILAIFGKIFTKMLSVQTTNVPIGHIAGEFEAFRSVFQNLAVHFMNPKMGIMSE